MHRARQFRRVVLLLPGILLIGGLLAGCHSQEEKPSAPGYYSGPLKGKGNKTADSDTAPDKKTAP